MKSLLKALATLVFIAFILSSCIQPAPNSRPWISYATEGIPPEILPSTEASTASIVPTALVTRDPNLPYYTPTPDTARTLPTLRPNEEIYVVQPGDNLGAIALKYNLDLGVLISANSLIDPNLLEVGQLITIPALKPSIEPSDFKIIPDSELVYGPASASFDIAGFIRERNGYLANYSEEVEDKTLTGTQIVERVSYEFSVNPRLLLALLEYRSGWVTSNRVDTANLDYPMQIIDPLRKGLYKQLSWAANQLNRGYYLWQVKAISYINLANGGLVMLFPTINAGTVGVQYALGIQTSERDWQVAVSEDGLYRTYNDFFGIPFDRTIEPLLPAGVTQPKMRLPFEPGTAWSFTGGPHAGWGTGSAWAALDFAPPGDQFGCFTSNAWVTAVADGVILRAGDGEVVQDFDGDGLEQTGWTVLYMHIETRDRIAAGTVVKAGDKIGHASCEGGFSNGTHLHLARRYNGEWISADTNLPFRLSGWVSTGDGYEYSGTLTKNGETVYSWDGRVEDNQIQY